MPHYKEDPLWTRRLEKDSRNENMGNGNTYLIGDKQRDLSQNEEESLTPVNTTSSKRVKKLRTESEVAFKGTERGKTRTTKQTNHTPHYDVYIHDIDIKHQRHCD
jgi:hypothetical protein